MSSAVFASPADAIGGLPEGRRQGRQPECFAFSPNFARMRSGGVGPSGMWYFAYGSNLNSRAVAEWCRHYGYRAPTLRPGQPAVLNNYRLSFPIFSEYWGGGIGDIVYDPGKYVMGALFDLSDAEISVLDAKVNRKLDSNNKEIGIYKRIDVKVSHSGKSELIPAITYQGISVERYHIPPTQHYMDLVIQGAYTYGLSMMWIAYLQSFPRQQGRKPRPPGTGDAAAKL